MTTGDRPELSLMLEHNEELQLLNMHYSPHIGARFLWLISIYVHYYLLFLFCTCVLILSCTAERENVVHVSGCGSSLFSRKVPPYEFEPSQDFFLLKRTVSANCLLERRIWVSMKHLETLTKLKYIIKL